MKSHLPIVLTFAAALAACGDAETARTRAAPQATSAPVSTAPAPAPAPTAAAAATSPEAPAPTAAPAAEKLLFVTVRASGEG